MICRQNVRWEGGGRKLLKKYTNLQGLVVRKCRRNGMYIGDIKYRRTFIRFMVVDNLSWSWQWHIRYLWDVEIITVSCIWRVMVVDRWYAPNRCLTLTVICGTILCAGENWRYFMGVSAVCRAKASVAAYLKTL